MGLAVGDTVIVRLHPDHNGGDPVATGRVTKVYTDRVPDPADRSDQPAKIEVTRGNVTADVDTDAGVHVLRGVYLFDGEKAADDWLATHRKLVPRVRTSDGSDDAHPDEVHRWVQVAYPAKKSATPATPAP